MSQTLLVEIFTEELPPKELKGLALNFSNFIKEELIANSIDSADVSYFAAPRRIAVQIKQVSSMQKDQEIEKIGPKINLATDKEGNPTKAALGFAKSCSTDFEKLSSIDTPQGEKLFYKQQVKGRPLKELIANIIAKSINKLPVKKRMRWGSNSYTFARPVHSLIVMHGSEILPAEEFKLASMNKTKGHRFASNGWFEIAHADDYEKILEQNNVIVSFEKRKNIIRKELTDAAKKLSATVEIDDTLLEEVTAIVDWPVILSADFDKEFLKVPDEALSCAIKSHQKCFPLYIEGKMINKFLLVTNTKADNYQLVISGNQKVMSARLADAKFFFEQDKKFTLESKTNKLGTVVFQKDLGSLLEKVERVKTISTALCEKTNANNDLVYKAASLYKCDLLSNMVGEFPELQGIMGCYYLLAEGGNKSTAIAIKESYLPRGANDNVPTSKEGLTLSIADKIDTLFGIFNLNMIPTGEKDPFALRRAALGIINILIKNKLSITINEVIEISKNTYKNSPKSNIINDETEKKLYLFFVERLKFLLQKNNSNSLVSSVLVNKKLSPYEVYLKLISLNNFSSHPDFEKLVEANKRVYNILNKNDLLESEFSTTNIELFETKEEENLYSTFKKVDKEIDSLLIKNDFSSALKLLAEIAPDLGNFFTNVMIMSENEKVKNNRLALLKEIREAFLKIADISLIKD